MTIPNITTPLSPGDGPGTGIPSDLRTLFQQRLFTDRPPRVCEDCGGYHLRACPRVKRKCFHPNGNLIEVEYWSYQDYDDSETIYPEDVWDEEETDD